MIAPAPGETFTGNPSGTIYTANSSGIVSGIMPNDVVAMLKAGCIFLNTLPLGRPQIVGANGGMPNGSRQGTAGGRTDTRLDGRRAIRLGASPVKELQLAFCNYYVSPGSGETLLGNDISVESSIELTSPTTFFQCTINQQQIANIPNGSPLALTDPAVGYDLAGDSTFFTRVSYSIASSSMFLPGTSGEPDPTSPSGSAGWLSSAGTSQVAGTGALTTPSGGAGYTDLPPLMVLGVCTQPQVSLIVLGDSIANGTGDPTADSFGNAGFIARGLSSVNGHQIPFVKLSCGSEGFFTNLLNNGARKRATWKYGTHFINEFVTNDVALSPTLATLQSQALAVATAAKRTIGPYGKPLHVTFTTCCPRTTSTYGLATPLPTIGNGGSGYAASATFNVTLAGGTLATGAGQSQAAQVSVTTNASGVVTTVNSVANIGYYTASGTTPGATNTPTGGTGTGLTFAGLTYAQGLDAVSQTPVTGFTVGGLRDQYNTWLKTQAGLGLIDVVLDVNTIWEDPNNHGKWLPSCFFDGTHPNAYAAFTGATNLITPWAATLTP
jgi:hypothetical protein